MGTRKVVVNGTERDAIEISFDVKSEPWCEYELLDGGRLRVRNIVVRVWMVLGDDGKPMINGDGDPTVVVNTQTVNVVLSR